MERQTTPRSQLARGAWRLILRTTLICGAVLLLACLHGWALARVQPSQESHLATGSSSIEPIEHGD